MPSNGARPRERGVSLASMTSAAPNPVPRSTVTSASASDVSSTASAGQPPSVMLKQSSWASREQIHTNGDGEPKAFVRNKSLWERTARTGNKYHRKFKKVQAQKTREIR